MIHVAVVEDEPKYRSRLQSYVTKYEEEYNEKIKLTVFSDGIDIVENYSARYDIIFMDIQMKHMDGMKAAKQIRQQDKNVIIIFITNLAQFALQGYEVEAMNYVLKPITYFAFSQELQKAVKRVKAKSAFYIHILQEGSLLRIDAAEITYIEIQNHDVAYHTTSNIYTNRDSLKSVEERLVGRSFSRCNNCYLVNLAHVEKVEKNEVIVAGESLRISRPRKKKFMEDLAAYIAGG